MDESTTLFLPANAEVLRVLRPQGTPGAGALPLHDATTTAKAKDRGASVSLVPLAGHSPAAANAGDADRRPR
jgi:hypothetical protein